MSEPFHHVKKRTLLAGAGVLFRVMFFRYNITSAAE